MTRRFFQQRDMREHHARDQCHQHDDADSALLRVARVDRGQISAARFIAEFDEVLLFREVAVLETLRRLVVLESRY